MYYSLSSASAIKPLYNLQKQALRQVCMPFRKIISHKMFGNTWVARQTNVLPLLLLSSYFACVSAHAIKTGQCPSYIASHFVPSSFKATCYQHKLPSSHYNKLNHYLVSTYNSLPLSLRRSHASAFKLKLKQYIFTTL